MLKRRSTLGIAMSIAFATELAPSGWYPDPAGSPMVRWWNGREWTEHLEAPRVETQPAVGYKVRYAIEN